MADNGREPSGFEQRKQMLKEQEEKERAYMEREVPEEQITEMCKLAINCFQNDDLQCHIMGNTMAKG